MARGEPCPYCGHRGKATQHGQAATPPFEVQDSHIRLPATPGLGIDLDEEVLKAHPAKDFPTRTIGD